MPPLVFLLNKSNLLQQYNISSVELIYCGGAPLDTSVIDDAKKKYVNNLENKKKNEMGALIKRAGAALADKSIVSEKTRIKLALKERNDRKLIACTYAQQWMNP